MNKGVFGLGAPSALTPVADTINEAGGAAYSLSPEAALATLMCVGTFNGTAYTKAEDQLLKFEELAEVVSPDFLGQCAVFSRQHAFMKDAPAVACAVLRKRGDLYT